MLEEFNKARKSYGNSVLDALDPQREVARQATQDAELERRRKAMAMDAMRGSQLLKAGQTGQVAQLLGDRLKYLQDNQIDASDTEQAMMLLQRGDLGGLQSAFDTVVNTSAAAGILDIPQASGTEWSSVVTGQDGNRYGIDKNRPDAGYQPIPMPEGVSVREGGQDININTGQTQGRAFGNYVDYAASSVDSFREQAASASDRLTRLRTLQQLNEANTTGVGTNARVGLGGVLNAIFGDGTADELLDTDVPAMQAFRALSQKMVNEELNEAKGPQTEGDAQRARQTVASLDKENDANKFILSYTEGINNRSIERNRFFRERVPRSASQTDEQFAAAFEQAETEWEAFKESTPLIAVAVPTEQPDGSMKPVVRTYPGTSIPMVYYDFERMFTQRNREKLKGMSAAQKREEAQKVWREINKLN
jgi:hypothetical protein